MNMPDFEEELVSVLGRMEPAGVAKLAVSYAEVLLIACESLFDAGDTTISAARSALSGLKEALEAPSANCDDGRTSEDLERLIPDEDQIGGVRDAVLQNMLAAVLYALRFRETGRIRDALWAARQLDEAGDVIDQFSRLSPEYVLGGDGDRLAQDAIASLLNLVESGRANTDRLEEMSRTFGHKLASLANGVRE